MKISNLVQVAFVAASAVCVSAHAKRTPVEMVEYHRQVARDAHALHQCLETRELKELNARVVAKRREAFHHLLQVRDRPSLDKWNAVNHDKTAEGKGKSFTDDESLFGYKHGDAVPASSCVLTPEVVWGPFYTDREAYRQDVRGGQAGVYQRLALQVIDVATCTPLHGARVDIWHANATGSYAKDAREQHGETTAHWLTGAQATSDWGLVDFDTIFPGNYGGRAVHTHVAVRPGDKFNDADGFVHAGQIFYDEDPRQVIGGIAPYTSNKNDVVDNMHDYYTSDAASHDYDPFAQWAWLDDTNHAAGLVTWTTIGVNTSFHSDHGGWW